MKFQEIQKLKMVKRTRSSSLLQESEITYNSSPKVGNFLINEIGSNAQESLVLLAFDTKLKLVAFGEISRGGVTRSIAEPADVFKRVLLSNATQFILAHNHPGGSLRPSNDDLKFMKRMQDASRIIGVEMLDFMIISSESYYSAAEKETLESGF